MAYVFNNIFWKIIIVVFLKEPFSCQHVEYHKKTATHLLCLGLICTKLSKQVLLVLIITRLLDEFQTI